METLRDLINNPVTNPYSIDMLAPNANRRGALAAKLKPLPTVSQVIDIDSFVPDDQQQKLAIIADAQSILAATLAPPASPPAPITPDQVASRPRPPWRRSTLPWRSCRRTIRWPPSPAICGNCRPRPTRCSMATNAALTRFLPTNSTACATALSAEPVTLASIPPDMARDWLLPNGRGAGAGDARSDLGKGSRAFALSSHR